MLKKIMTLVKSIIIIFIVIVWLQMFLTLSINRWWTNAESDTVIIENTGAIIPASNFEVYKYIHQHPEDADDIKKTYIYLNWTGRTTRWWFPDNNWWLDFVIAGINKRKTFVDSINYYSEQLWVDRDIVLACVLWEQIRIANKGARWKLKDVIVHWTPTLFRSYDVSLWLGWIKVSTARQIARYAIDRWYADDEMQLDYWMDNSRWTNRLINDDQFNAKYATYLVQNIVDRWFVAGHDISMNPWVVCTLYNMWNSTKKEPHTDPQIGWSVIKIWAKDYVYWWLSQWVYRYLKMFYSL